MMEKPGESPAAGKKKRKKRENGSHTAFGWGPLSLWRLFEYEERGLPRAEDVWRHWSPSPPFLWY